jgi:MFS family permease
MLLAARTAMGFQFQSVASIAPFLTESIRIGYTEIGTLIGLYMLPGVVMALPGGMLGPWIGDKWACAAGLALMIVGSVVFALSGSYGPIFAGRIISGVGAVLFNLVITKMVTDWFVGREIVTAMGMMLASWPFGIAIALVAQTPLVIDFGWPAAIWSTVVLCAVAMALVLVLYRPPPTTKTLSPLSVRIKESKALPLREVLAIAAAGGIWGVFNVGLVVFFSFTPALLAERGLSLVSAGALVSLGLWASMPSLPLGGWLAERSGHPRAAIILFSVASGIVLLLLTYGPFPALLCALLGICIGPPAAAIMALPAQVLSPQQRALGLGVFYTVYYVAMAVGPFFAGLCRDHWHTASAAIFFGVALYWSIPPSCAVFRFCARAGARSM